MDYYALGATTYFAAKADPRFGYYLYVPKSYDRARAVNYRLVVLIHGSSRTPQTYRDLFAEFAEEHDVVVLAPMFPSGIYVQGDEANYKFMRCHDLRFDHVLLAMVDEVRAAYGLAEQPFLMHGFSGGGHFAHRFFYLHPAHLSAVSIGAPGMVTLLDEAKDWHCGVRNIKTLFGHELDIGAMRCVPAQMVVGGDDTETWEITIPKDDSLWMDGVNDAGRTRLERLEALKDSFEAHGISVRHDVVPNVAHNGYAILGPVKDFFARHLQQQSNDKNG